MTVFKILRDPIRSLLIPTFALCLLLGSAGAEEAHEAPPTLPSIVVIDESSVLLTEDHRWMVTAHPAPRNIIPIPAVRLDLPEPIDPEGAYLVLSLSPGGEVHVAMTGLRAGNSSMVYPSRTVASDPMGERRVLWSLEPHVGDPSPMGSFEISLVAPGREAEAVVVEGIGIVQAEQLADHELLEASPFEVMTVRHVEIHHRHQEQDVAIILPEAFASRHEGRAVHLLMEGEKFAHATLEHRPGRPWEWRPSIPVSVGGDREVALLLMLESGEEEQNQFTDLATTAFTALHSPGPGRFEIPYQSIHHAAVSARGPDLAVAVVANDLLTRPEAPAVARSNREVLDARVSLASGRFELHQVMRLGQHDNWAEAGFRSVGRVSVRPGVEVFLLSGSNGYGIESLGVVNFFGGSPMAAALNNPAYQSSPAFAGMEEGDGVILRGATGVVGPDGEERLLLLHAAEGGESTRILLISTLDFRVFEEVGVVDLPLGEADGLHLQMVRVDDLHYLLTDNPGRLFVSSDPMGDWVERRIDFPAGWRGLQLAEIQGTWYLFGIENIRGRGVLRWAKVNWEEKNDAVPHPVPRVMMPHGGGDIE